MTNIFEPFDDERKQDLEHLIVLLFFLTLSVLNLILYFRITRLTAIVDQLVAFVAHHGDVGFVGC